MKKNLFFITVCLVSLIFALGFYLEDPGKKNTDPTHVKINTGIIRKAEEIGKFIGEKMPDL